MIEFAINNPWQLVANSLVTALFMLFIAVLVVVLWNK